MQTDGWKYYNHAAIPTTAPYEEPDMTPINNGCIWKIGGSTPLFARWTTEFDCGHETNWWYVIKDTPLDISMLKAKRRYEINKGLNHFDVKPINPCDYKEELYAVQVSAFSAYPKKYRPTVEKNRFMTGIDGWNNYFAFGAFYRETGEMTGYALLMENENWVDFSVLKTKPEYEKYAVNAALCEGVLSHYSQFLSVGGIICDGARSISHETNFQDYLEKYFGFRKAYCRLHIQYNPKIKWLVKLLFPLRKCLFFWMG